MKKVLEAIYFASQAHKNQRRKNAESTPYINHPIEVMNLLSDAISGTGIDVDKDNWEILCAAVLHDTIEDTNVTYQEIENKFGINVADYVKEVTDNKSDPKIKRKQDQITHALITSDEAKLIKLADKLSNLSDIDKNPPVNWSKDEINEYVYWCYAVCDNLRNFKYLRSQMISIILFDKLNPIFEKYKVLNIKSNELNILLEKYYTVIQNNA